MKYFALCLLPSLILLTSSPANAQRPQNTETRTGTVKEVQQKGKSRILVVNCSGEELSFPLSPKVGLEINLTGADHSVLQKGAYLEGSGTLSNNKLFLETAKIRLLPATAKAPESKIAKPEELTPGQSLNAQNISGLIMAQQVSKDYPEYEEVALKPGPSIPVLMVKKDLAIDLVSSDIDDIQPDQEVELEVIEGRNDKLTLVRATVEGGQYVPKEEEKGKKKTK